MTFADNNSEFTITRYVRKQPNWNQYRGQPVGLVMLHVNRQTGDLSFGFSRCNKVDRFSKEVARDYAMNVMRDGWINGKNEVLNFKASLHDPQSIVNCINNMPWSLRETASEAAMSAVRRYWNHHLRSVKLENIHA